MSKKAFVEAFVDGVKQEKGAGCCFIIGLFILAALAFLAIPAQASAPIVNPPRSDCASEWESFEKLFAVMQDIGWNPRVESVDGVDRRFVRVVLPEVIWMGRAQYPEVTVVGWDIQEVPRLLVEAYYERIGQ